MALSFLLRNRWLSRQNGTIFKPLLLLCALILAAFALVSCDTQSSATNQDGNGAEEAPEHPALSGTVDKSHAGEPAPKDLVFLDSDGKEKTLADFAGKPILLNLWATWCAPCIVEMPMLDALAKDEAERLHVLTISQDLNGEEAVKEFFAKNNFSTIKPYLDSDNLYATAFEVSVMPTTILIDKNGKEVLRVLGGMHWNSKKAHELIAPSLGK